MLTATFSSTNYDCQRSYSGHWQFWLLFCHGLLQCIVCFSTFMTKIWWAKTKYLGSGGIYIFLFIGIRLIKDYVVKKKKMALRPTVEKSNQPIFFNWNIYQFPFFGMCSINLMSPRTCNYWTIFAIVTLYCEFLSPTFTKMITYSYVPYSLHTVMYYIHYIQLCIIFITYSYVPYSLHTVMYHINDIQLCTILMTYSNVPYSLHTVMNHINYIQLCTIFMTYSYVPYSWHTVMNHINYIQLFH